MSVAVSVAVRLVVAIFSGIVPMLVMRILGLSDSLEVRLELAMALLTRQWADLQVDVAASHLGLLIAMPHGVEVFLDPGC